MGAAVEQMTALVIEADDPLDNRVKLSKKSLGMVRILIDTKPDPIYVGRRFKLDRDHWPVRGMELPVTIDPADPEKFEIRWDEVPSIEERAAANDPTLADPVGTHNKAMEALIASGAAGPGGDAAPKGVRDVVVAAQVSAFKSGDTTDLDHFKESMDKAAQESAPDGKTRAVVLIAASEATLKVEGGDADGGGGTYVRERHGKHDAVFAVNVPGSAPYAVFKPKFKHRRGKGAAVGAGLPAVVSSSDPTDVEILWDDLLSVKDQTKQTAAEAMQTAQSRMAEAMNQVSQTPPAPPTAPPAGVGNAPQTPGATPQISPQQREMMIQNAKVALASAPPQIRQMMIQQYRMAGIEIDEQGNVSE